MDPIIHLQGDTDCSLTPLFLVHAISGLALPYLRLESLSIPGKERAVYGINAPIFGSKPLHEYPSSLQQLASHYIKDIKTIQPHGPYLLGGWSMGGMIAMNVARILLGKGEAVLRVIMIDSANPEAIPSFRSSEEQRTMTSRIFNTTVTQSLQLSTGHEQQEDEGYQGWNDSETDDDDESGIFELNKFMGRIRTHVYKGLALISNVRPGQLIKGHYNTHAVLIKCDFNDEAVRSDHTSRVVRGIMREKTMMWDTKRFRRFETVGFSAEHDGAFDHEHITELTGILRSILKDVR